MISEFSIIPCEICGKKGFKRGREEIFVNKIYEHRYAVHETFWIWTCVHCGISNATFMSASFVDYEYEKNPRFSYKELLKHPKWQKKRLKIMERDLWSCRKCGNEDVTLNIHHKYYVKDRNPWDYPDNDLITLCEECHKVKHNNRGVGER